MQNSWLEKHKSELLNILKVDKEDDSLVIKFHLESASAVVRDYLEMMVEEIVDEKIGVESKKRLLIPLEKLDSLDNDSMSIVEFILEQNNQSISDFKKIYVPHSLESKNKVSVSFEEKPEIKVKKDQQISDLKQEEEDSIEFYMTLTYEEGKKLINAGNISSEFKSIVYAKEKEYFNQLSYDELNRIKSSGNKDYISHKLLLDSIEKKKPKKEKQKKKESSQLNLNQQVVQKDKRVPELSSDVKSDIDVPIVEEKISEKKVQVLEYSSMSYNELKKISKMNGIDSLINYAVENKLYIE